MTEQEKREFNELAYYCMALNNAYENMDRTIDHKEWVSSQNTIDFNHAMIDRWAKRNIELVRRIGREGS